MENRLKQVAMCGKKNEKEYGYEQRLAAESAQSVRAEGHREKEKAKKDHG